jgi:hypothetical protein
MTGKRPITLTYSELYLEPTNNPFGSDEKDLESCTRAVFEVFLSTGPPLAEEELLQNIQADVCRPIACILVCVPDAT